MKNVLFILLASQFLITPQFVKCYGMVTVGDNNCFYNSNREKRGIEEGTFERAIPQKNDENVDSLNVDVLSKVIIDDSNGNRKTIKKDIFGDIVIEDDRGYCKTIKKDVLGDIVIEDDKGNCQTVEEDILVI